ncbi:MAG: N-acetyl-gamma-glutamyl-phosphate reductase [Acidimicrobiia bacterium]|nr:N-acetyl-gamma-glutamyl-phosphate reductase [Acidimicrobiia bacterium]
MCALHPELEVVIATGDSMAGRRAAELYPSLEAAFPTLVFAEYDLAALDGLDVVFLAMPHGASQSVVPELIGKVGVICDLAADFRLQDPDLYPQWYGEVHKAPELLSQFAYGIPELFREPLVGCTKIATPGCYPTAAALALAPLMRAGVLHSTGVIVDAASGVSGAGRTLKANTQFCAVDEDVTAYGLLDHRHTPEMEQAIGAQVLFTPHLVPTNRGILATCYARPTGAVTTESLLGILSDAYRDDPFMVVRPTSPSTKATLGTNCCHLTARYDDRTGWVMVLAAIDNLVKGTAGQAVQCLNLALGFPETLGLPMLAAYP